MNYSVHQTMQTSGVAFGTSGARGLVSAMSDKVCYIYTQGFLSFLIDKNLFEKGQKVAISGDLRASSPRIKQAVIRAVQDFGCEAIDCGYEPSPALAFYAFNRNIPSIMVTGSHIPDDRNGIKFNKPQGELLKEDEPFMLDQWIEIDDELFDQNSMLHDNAYPVFNDTITVREEYQNRYIQFFGDKALKGLKIGIYQHSAVGRDLLHEVFEALGASTVLLGRSDLFIPVDTEAIRPDDVKLGKQWADEFGLDAIVSTDGDSDRPLISDEEGQWLKGDVLGILTASILGINKIAIPVSCNTAAEKSGLFQQVIRTKIGSPYVINAMNSENLDAGFEANGGFILCNNLNGLHKLPTRDAFLPMIALLSSALKSQKKVSELVNELPNRFTQSGLIKETPRELSNSIIHSLSQCKIGDKIIGLSENTVLHIDQTDGLRLSFENLDIIHFRPSGNAPELRIYAESTSNENALKILDEAKRFLKNKLLI